MIRLYEVMERVTNHIARTEGHKGLDIVTGIQDDSITGNHHQEPIHCLSREREEREREREREREGEREGERERGRERERGGGRGRIRYITDEEQC